MAAHAERPRSAIGLILIETSWKARQRPYHQQKLALVLTNLRHFALEAQEADIRSSSSMTTDPTRPSSKHTSKHSAHCTRCVGPSGKLGSPSNRWRPGAADG